MILASLQPIGRRVTAVHELPLRAAAVVGLVLLAYNYSLISLARGLTTQGPLAYLALVPVIAVGLAAARLQIEPRALPIHDRQLDWIVGIGFLGIAAAVILLSDPASSAFWLQRIDLLTLPLFVAGLVALLFGVRRVWSLKVPIAFLLLAWPVPYTLFLSNLARQFADFTAHFVAAFMLIIPVAHPAPVDDTMFLVGSGANAFSVSVVSASASINSLVGFVVIGMGLLCVVRGPAVRRIAWLSIGLGLIFGLSVARIISILGIGASLGQAAALDALHPVTAVLVFIVGVLALVTLVPRFGLRFIHPADRPGPKGPGEPSPVRRVWPALLVALYLAGILAGTNAAYARFDAVSDFKSDGPMAQFTGVTSGDIGTDVWQVVDKDPLAVRLGPAIAVCRSGKLTS